MTELSVDAIYAHITGWYEEMGELSRMEPDEALMLVARIETEVAQVRGLALRSQSRQVSSAVRREIDPLLGLLANQAKLIGRAAALRRSRNP